jgi:hypothetical protein
MIFHTSPIVLASLLVSPFHGLRLGLLLGVHAPAFLVPTLPGQRNAPMRHCYSCQVQPFMPASGIAMSRRVELAPR